MITATSQLLNNTLPGCKDPHAWADTVNCVLPQFDITTRSLTAAFIAQARVESAAISVPDENLFYTTARRSDAVWPKHFPAGANTLAYLPVPEALGKFLYAKRMGNGDVASGDDYRFLRLRLLQILGRSDYGQIREAKLPLQKNADMLADPKNASLSATYFWRAIIGMQWAIPVPTIWNRRISGK